MVGTPYEVLQENPYVGRIRLQNSALSFNPREVVAFDDQWLLLCTPSGSVQIENTATQHVVALEPTDVVSVSSDKSAPNDGLVHLVVSLKRTLGLCGPHAWWLAAKPKFRRIRKSARSMHWQAAN